MKRTYTLTFRDVLPPAKERWNRPANGIGPREEDEEHSLARGEWSCRHALHNHIVAIEGNECQGPDGTQPCDGTCRNNITTARKKDTFCWSVLIERSQSSVTVLKLVPYVSLRSWNGFDTHFTTVHHIAYKWSNEGKCGLYTEYFAKTYYTHNAKHKWASLSIESLTSK